MKKINGTRIYQLSAYAALSVCRDKLFVFPFRLLTSAWFTRQRSEDYILNNTGMATVLLSKQLNFFWRLKKSTCSRTCHISCYQDFLSWSMNFSCYWYWLSLRSFGHEEKNLRVMKWSLNPWKIIQAVTLFICIRMHI